MLISITTSLSLLCCYDLLLGVSTTLPLAATLALPFANKIFSLSLSQVPLSIQEARHSATTREETSMSVTTPAATPFKSLLTGLLFFLLSSSSTTTVHAFDYNVTAGDDTSIFLTDAKTGIPGLKTIFLNDVTLVAVNDVVWEESGVGSTGNDFLTYQTLVNGELQAEGTIDLTGVGRQLPSSLDVGNVTIPKSTYY